jgi:acyl-CoA synthetase (AMP-forming)/AMP-acid ligase II
VILDDPKTIERWRQAGWWGTTTIDDLFRACVAARPGQLALVDAPNRAAFAPGAPRQLSFAEVDDRVDGLAATLHGAGVRKDDVVVVQLPNIVEIVIAFLACARLGAIVSPIMLAYGERDVRRIVRHLRPAAFLTLAAWKDGRPAAVAARVVAEAPTPAPADAAAAAATSARDAAPRRTAVLALGEDSTAGVLAAPSIEQFPGDREALRACLATLTIDANEIVTLHWTSGTTGEPKCVPRSHNQWHGTGHACTDGGGLEAGERILAPMQMVHTAGYSGMFMPWLETQGMLALHQPFDMGLFLDQIEQLRINHTVAAPAMLNALLKSNALDGRDLSSVRSFLCGSAPLDPWMIEGFRTRHGIEVVNAYGSTEGMTFMCGPTMTADPHRRARYFPRLRGAATDTGGVDWKYRIAAVVETRLVDPDTGVEIDAPRQPGELVFRSPALFPGYWTETQQLDRRDFDAEGYFRSGELFEIAGEGENARYYHYIDRLKDVINRGGLKIPVGELEAAIQSHPAVAEAVAIGYPDEKLGERICAVVAPRPGATLTLAELVAHLEAQQIARYMLPERLERVTALPRNPSGKPLKRELVARIRGAAAG